MAGHRPAIAAEERVGGLVRDLDPEVVCQADDAHADEVGEIGKVTHSLPELELGRVGAVPVAASRASPISSSARPRDQTTASRTAMTIAWSEMNAIGSQSTPG